MVKERKYIGDLHFEHKMWDNELSFFKEEISILEPYLSGITHKYTDSEVLASLEHFQNQFLLQKENIRELQHKVKAHEKNLSTFAHEHPVAIDHHHFTDHRTLREGMDRQKAIYYDLKKEFMLFLQKWM